MGTGAVTAGTQAGAGRAKGQVSPGFEAVASAMEELVADDREKGLAVSVYLHGEPVVDAWCGRANGEEPWSEDTLAIVFSCTKGMTALCAHILIDRGLLDPEAKVVAYWPEFGQAGKEATLVRHLLNHTSGVLSFPRYWELFGPDPARLGDLDAIAPRLAAAAPAWEPGTQTAYHALTYGWLTAELVRRIDGRSIGRFFAEEVAQPLGLEAWIGSPPEHDPRVASPFSGGIADPAALQAARETAAKAAAGLRAGDFSSLAALGHASLFLPVEEGLDLGDVPQALADMLDPPAVRRVEVPGGGAVADARSLAKMYGALAVGGSLDGARLVSPESIPLVSAHRPTDKGAPTGFALGYVAMPDMPGGTPGPRKGAFGHPGAGGNLGFADPASELGFGLVKNKMTDDRTAAGIIKALYTCI